MSTLELAAIIWVAGFVIGLGAISVIESIGFLGQRSEYWTEATIRAHKVTKVLIWLGLGIAVVGGWWFYAQIGQHPTMIIHAILLPIMILNGSFLSFWVSPRLLQREREGRATEILPKSWKIAITYSFFVSIATWWTSMVLMVLVLMRYRG